MDTNDKILFSGPWVKFGGTLPTRVVLHAKVSNAAADFLEAMQERARLDPGAPAVVVGVGSLTAAPTVQEYIVHYQYRREDGKLGYESGDYFQLPFFRDAMACFWERCRRFYTDRTSEVLAFPEPEKIDMVFDGPAGPEAGRFVDVEDSAGKSISLGQWVPRENGLWALRFARPEGV